MQELVGQRGRCSKEQDGVQGGRQREDRLWEGQAGPTPALQLGGPERLVYFYNDVEPWNRMHPH